MGIKNIDNIPDNYNDLDDSNYIQEKELKEYPKSVKKKDLKRIIEQMEKSVCKIICDDGFGTGFFCKIPFPDNSKLLPMLVTNYHILGNDINNNKIINISLDDDKVEHIIDLSQHRKKYCDSTYDISMIEIITKDNLDNISYLEIEENILEIQQYDKFNNSSIYLLHFPHGDSIECSLGVIKKISENGWDILHLCETQKGSSGSPIINLKNFKVIGIHKGAKKNENCNIGTFIKRPIKEFNIIHKKEKKEIVKLNDDLIIKEKGIKGNLSPKLNMSQIEIIMNQMKKSVCKIITNNIGQLKIGTGFFCNIPLFKGKGILPVLITDNEIINNKDILPGKEISFSIDDDKSHFKLKMDNSRKILTNRNMDFTLIEIKSTDKLDSDSFLEIDNIILEDSNKILNNIYIYLMHYSLDNVVNYSTGTLTNVCENKLRYIVDTELGASGGPILNLSNYKLLGLHCGKYCKNQMRCGTYIKQIVEKFNDYYLSFDYNYN